MDATDKKATKETAQKKRERLPINGTRQILAVRGQEPGFHYAWINEENVFAMQESGFEHVRHAVQVGSRRIDVSTMPAGSYITRNVGGGVIAHLMRIPEEFYAQDMQSLQKEVDDKTRAQIGNLSKDGLDGQVKVTRSFKHPFDVGEEQLP